MTDEVVFASYPVYKAIPERITGLDKDLVAKEVAALLEEYSDRIETRGIYSTTGFTARADLMAWWVARSADDIQDLTVALRRTRLGSALEPVEAFMGLVRPAEFSPGHMPAFASGKPPKRYLCVYPFVRTPEWYLLEPSERAKLLREHGEAAHPFSDIQANTTSAFGLGDYEWILAFEADSPDRFVDLIRALRATEARRYMKVEVPFITGIRKDVADALADLF